jgi:uncharacterized membrane protein
MEKHDPPAWKLTPYNVIAGGSVERLAALSDGIFGVAMTLLLLELHVPAKELVHNEADLLGELAKMGPAVVVYLMSFITLGIFWVGQQTQLTHLERSDRHLTWMYLGFLFAVTLLPFSTRLLASFVTYRTALLVYWGNILLLGVLVYCCWSRAVSTKLVREEVTVDVDCAMKRRIIWAQGLYALGAALCVINTYVSIAFIVLVQINFVVAPRIRWLSKI